MAAKDKEIEDLKRRVIEVNFTFFYILSNFIKTKGNMHDDFLQVQRQYEEIYGTKLEDLQEVEMTTTNCQQSLTKEMCLLQTTNFDL